MARLISSNSGLVHVFIIIHLLRQRLLYFPPAGKKIFDRRAERMGN
jgi:hypothetical protein